MTDQAVELEEVRDEVMKLAEELDARGPVIGLDKLAQQVAELAKLVGTIAHHAAGEIKNRRLLTNTP